MEFDKVDPGGFKEATADEVRADLDIQGEENEDVGPMSPGHEDFGSDPNTDDEEPEEYQEDDEEFDL